MLHHAVCVITGLLLLADLGLENPTSSEALAKKAAQAWKSGAREKAIELMNMAIKADPKAAEYPYLRGSMYEMAGKNSEAVADFSQAIKLDPMNAEAYNHRGSAHFKLGKIAESV